MSRITVSRVSATVAVALAVTVLYACSDREGPGLPAGPRLATTEGGSCDFREANRLADAYFPGDDEGSLEDRADAILFQMDDTCRGSDAGLYTDAFFRLAELIEEALETGTGGAPADADDLVWELIGSPARDAIFDPCAGAPACTSWDGFPTRPDLVEALSAGGTWAVVRSGSDAVCGGHRSPCANIDPDPFADGETWGVEPSTTWDDALHGRTSLLFGNPLAGGSPTGEASYSAGASGYSFNLVPHPDAFRPAATPPAVLEVGLCSTAVASIDEALIQKGSTVLEQATLGFCPIQTAAAPASFWGRLAGLIGDLFDPRPAALVATAFRLGPGGGAGSWSDFWAIDVPEAAAFEIFNPPTEGDAGAPIAGEDGNPVSVRAVTTSAASPIEHVSVTVSFERNNGFLRAGDVISTSPDFVCDGARGECTGTTQRDEQAAPGVIQIPVILTKPGAYRMCVTGELPPLSFEPACSSKFVIRPPKRRSGKRRGGRPGGR